ncbi:hypothetical protein FV232_27170 [Methylobacterium sp. WL30]|uniref:hypothetical protein n=1 Tax=unclassified Methylobacterium TaxID=2615210 RepID=UPI0011CAC9AD|nr:MULTISPECIES: hypothetical protein [unclassified Methylobacterium]TXN40684.1 hypothetical protein FV225_05410 [Methylobacterium sp. WL93]TXN50008.1 hypothetical protein FV227_14095 [Methylobacterium sp. WL119]TXN61406.1 hypothetical protein FV232_27170 [Methylobacterium sp. WL30]
MTPNLMTRLTRLEGQAVPPPAAANTFTPGIRLLLLLLAVHTGSLRPKQSIAEGVARALGYQHVREMWAAMQADGTALIEWNCRHREAVTLLLRQRNGGPSAGMDHNEVAIQSLIADMPEAFQAYPYLVDAEPAISLATEWVSL